MAEQTAAQHELATLVVESLNLETVTPEQIDPDAPLFGGELGLDSVDAVGFILAVEKRFSIEITDGDLARFPLSTLRDVAVLLAAKGVPSDRGHRPDVRLPDQGPSEER